MLQLGDSGNHQRVQPQWAPGLLACFPEILLFVTGFCFLSCPYSHCDSRQSFRCDGEVKLMLFEVLFHVSSLQNSNYRN